MEQHARRPVLAVIDGYRVTGPARQLLAQAAATRDRTPMTVAVFQRGAGATPLVDAARRLRIPTRIVPDRFPGDPRTAQALARLVADPGVDILQTHGYKANVIGALIARRIGRPWVAFVHGDTWQNWKVRAYFALERLAIRRADRVVAVSRHMAQALRAGGIPDERVRVIHNASLAGTCHEAPAAWNDGAPPIVGVVGRLSPEKGVDIACRVQQCVQRLCPGARLWIIGEGPEEARLRDEVDRLGIGRSVEWRGFQDDVAPLYRQMSVLLIPSRSEGLPNVALEAMAHGVPVVGTSVGGVPEVVADDSTGYLVPTGDVEALASRVVELLRDASIRRRLGSQAREAVRTRFSAAARHDRLVELYEELDAYDVGRRGSGIYRARDREIFPPDPREDRMVIGRRPS